MLRLFVCFMLIAQSAIAETVIATRTIRPQQIISVEDVRIDAANLTGAHQTLDAVIGQEAKVAIYPGRAVMQGHVGAPALVVRNQVVELVYLSGGLRIVAEGRALGRGAEGDRIRVMNLASRSVIFGSVSAAGVIFVTK